MKPKVCANCKYFAIAGNEQAPMYLCAAHCRWELVDIPTRHMCLKDFEWADEPQYEVEEQTDDMNQETPDISQDIEAGEHEAQEQ